MSNDKVTERENEISIGVSACLLGAKVRFDGGHKRDRYINDLLTEHFNFVPFCPEVAIGMGTPRQPIRLVDDQGNIRAIGTREADRDYTTQLNEYGTRVAETLDSLCGFVFKKDSPSCGMERVKVYADNGIPDKKGTGLFADKIMKKNPLLPVEDEGRLNDPVLRENFINRVYVYSRWKNLLDIGISKSALLDFHTRHKYLLLAHNQQAYRDLGRMLSSLDKANLAELSQQYIRRVMAVLKQRASRKTHVNVMQHLLGFLRPKLDVNDRAEMLDTIKAYARGEYPLVVPITLLKHHFRCNPHPFVNRQVYLDPHPRAMMLRNTI
jgi:uncharacterized protein YbgA (DUF1722 family)/uncharacterized protein YbbK (DUF523 family)